MNKCIWRWRSEEEEELFLTLSPPLQSSHALALSCWSWKHVGHRKNLKDHKTSVFDPHKLFLLSIFLYGFVVCSSAPSVRIESWFDSIFEGTLPLLENPSSHQALSLVSWLYHEIDFLWLFKVRCLIQWCDFRMLQCL